MTQVRLTTAGLALAAVSGIGHAGWALLVALGLAQPLIDLIFRLHFMKPLLQVGPFAWSTAVELVLYALLAGYILGVVAAFCWNAFARRAAAAP